MRVRNKVHTRITNMLTTAVLQRLAVSLFFVATVSAPALLVA